MYFCITKIQLVNQTNYLCPSLFRCSLEAIDLTTSGSIFEDFLVGNNIN